MFVYKLGMFFPGQFHLMCSVLLLYLLIVLHNCKKTHISNFMIRLLLLESTSTISLSLGKTRVSLTITKFLMFLLGGFHCRFSDLKRYIYHLNIQPFVIYIVFSLGQRKEVLKFQEESLSFLRLWIKKGLIFHIHSTYLQNSCGNLGVYPRNY